MFQSTVCSKIIEALESNSANSVRQHIEVISQECFYKELTEHQLQLATKGQMNFDHPGTDDCTTGTGGETAFTVVVYHFENVVNTCLK